MNTYRAGIDIGSTTVKLVLLNEQKELVFGKYIRHGARTQEALASLLQEAKALLGDCRLLPRITGSGSINLGKALDIPFVQEVVAVTSALRQVAPRPTWPSSWAVRTPKSSISRAVWRSV